MQHYKIPWHGWVVACDGAKALIMQNEGDDELINLKVIETLDQRHAATHMLGTDRPGRVFESASAARSAVRQTDWHDQAETAFLTMLSERLHSLVERRDIKHLVLVAPPKAMGVLRTKLSDRVAAIMQAEIEKDLVKLPVYEIEQHLTA